MMMIQFIFPVSCLIWNFSRSVGVFQQLEVKYSSPHYPSFLVQHLCVFPLSCVFHIRLLFWRLGLCQCFGKECTEWVCNVPEAQSHAEIRQCFLYYLITLLAGLPPIVDFKKFLFPLTCLPLSIITFKNVAAFPSRICGTYSLHKK